MVVDSEDVGGKKIIKKNPALALSTYHLVSVKVVVESKRSGKSIRAPQCYVFPLRSTDVQSA